MQVNWIKEKKLKQIRYRNEKSDQLINELISVTLKQYSKNNEQYFREYLNFQ